MFLLLSKAGHQSIVDYFLEEQRKMHAVGSRKDKYYMGAHSPFCFTGSYKVNLPDGRVQTVTYTADDYGGFVADVK